MTLMRGYDVEWIKEDETPMSGDEPIFENAPIRHREFPTITGARAFAKKAAAESFFGVATVAPFWREPYEPGWPGLRKEIDRDHGEEVEP